MDARGGFARVRRRELNARRVRASPGRGSRLAVAASPESARDSSDPVSSFEHSQSRVSPSLILSAPVKKRETSRQRAERRAASTLIR